MDLQGRGLTVYLTRGDSRDSYGGAELLDHHKCHACVLRHGGEEVRNLSKLPGSFPASTTAKVDCGCPRVGTVVPASRLRVVLDSVDARGELAVTDALSTSVANDGRSLLPKQFNYAFVRATSVVTARFIVPQWSRW